jgi:hypothetical protein
MAEKMKRMQSPKASIRVERRYVFSVAGMELKGRFREVETMAGMKLLKDDKGQQVVIDTSDNFFEEIMAQFLGEEEKTLVSVGIIKASPSMLDEMKEAIETAKMATADGKEDEVVRVPVTEPPESGEEGAGE